MRTTMNNLTSLSLKTTSIQHNYNIDDGMPTNTISTIPAIYLQSLQDKSENVHKVYS